MASYNIGRRALLTVTPMLTFGAGCRRGPITAAEPPASGYGAVDTRNSVVVPLRYRPTKTRSGVYAPVKTYVFAWAVDERTEKSAIGQNVERATPIAVVAADDPAAFVRGVVVRQLQSLGAKVTIEPAGASAQLVLHLTRFWVTEADEYRAEVTLRAEVLDPKGQTRWEGIVMGSATNFGRSFSVVNYQETFSDATMQAADKLLSDPACMAALAQQADVRGGASSNGLQVPTRPGGLLEQWSPGASGTQGVTE